MSRYRYNIAVINGPNLNLLGTREPDTYGRITLMDTLKRLKQSAERFKVELSDFQSNSEGAIVDEIQRAAQGSQGIILNPGAYTHTSIAIRDAVVAAGDMPVIEVHISNIFQREPFRHHSFISDVASGVIIGFGVHGYELALQAMIRRLDEQQPQGPHLEPAG